LKHSVVNSVTCAYLQRLAERCDFRQFVDYYELLGNHINDLVVLYGLDDMNWMFL